MSPEDLDNLERKVSPLWYRQSVSIDPDTVLALIAGLREAREATRIAQADADALFKAITDDDIRIERWGWPGERAEQRLLAARITHKAAVAGRTTGDAT